MQNNELALAVLEHTKRDERDFRQWTDIEQWMGNEYLQLKKLACRAQKVTQRRNTTEWPSAVSNRQRKWPRNQSMNKHISK